MTTLQINTDDGTSRVIETTPTIDINDLVNGEGFEQLEIELVDETDLSETDPMLPNGEVRTFTSDVVTVSDVVNQAPAPEATTTSPEQRYFARRDEVAREVYERNRQALTTMANAFVSWFRGMCPNLTVALSSLQLDPYSGFGSITLEGVRIRIGSLPGADDGSMIVNGKLTMDPEQFILEQVTEAKLLGATTPARSTDMASEVSTGSGAGI